MTSGGSQSLLKDDGGRSLTEETKRQPKMEVRAARRMKTPDVSTLKNENKMSQEECKSNIEKHKNKKKDNGKDNKKW